MKYRGSNLILDNFRSVMGDYDVDIQDVVRSAILDGVDISDYIESCKEEPYKLDQIRLSIKEDVPAVLFSSLNGEQLYIIRKLRAKNYNIEPIISQITSGRLSECYLDFLISWVTKGVDVSGIKLSLIPKKMLEVFDMHLCQGRDMRPFNNGKVYSKEYVLYCMSIQERGKDITRFATEDWSLEVLSDLAGVVSSVSDKVWQSVISVLTPKDSRNRVALMFRAAKYKLPINQLGMFGSSLGTVRLPVYDDESVATIIEAAKGGFDWKSLMQESLSADERRARLDEMKMHRGRKVGGVLRKG